MLGRIVRATGALAIDGSTPGVYTRGASSRINDYLSKPTR